MIDFQKRQINSVSASVSTTEMTGGLNSNVLHTLLGCSLLLALCGTSRSTEGKVEMIYQLWGLWSYYH
jgi:hypothetical protein